MYFLRTQQRRILVAIVLIVFCIVTLLAMIPYHQEQRIAREIQAAGGTSQFRYWGPNWIPDLITSRCVIWDRVWDVDLTGRDVPMSLLQQLHGLTSNESINLSRTRLNDSGLEQLRPITSLWRLELRDTHITDVGLEYLNGNSELRWLDLSRTRVNGSGVQQLDRLKKLRRLILSETRVTNTVLEHLGELTSLGWLDLRETAISDDGLRYLKPLIHLRELLLDATQTTAEGRAELRKVLTNCMITPDP